MIVGVAMVRDEQDIIGYCCRNLLENDVDHLIVADNLSLDDTRFVLDGFRGSVTILTDDDPAYNQAKKMTRLASLALNMGADWVLPFDADEFWYAPDTTINEALTNCTADVIRAQGWDHLPTKIDIPSLNPFEAMPFRQPEPQKLPKVAFRAHPDARLHVGNHDVDHPGTRTDGVLEYRHFQWRSCDQLIRKVRQGKQALEAANLHFNYGTHWRTLGAMNDLDLKAYWNDLESTSGLVCDPVL